MDTFPFPTLILVFFLYLKQDQASRDWHGKQSLKQYLAAAAPGTTVDPRFMLRMANKAV